MFLGNLKRREKNVPVLGGEWEAYSCAGKQLGRQSEANKSSKARLAGEETEAPECRVTPLMRKQSVSFQSKGESKEAQSPFMESVPT